MPSIDLVIPTRVERTVRVRQLEALFDVPSQNESKLEWHGELPIDDTNWNVGLILGPSGCGKTQILRSLYPDFERPLTWDSRSVVDNFEAESMEDITSICSAVGFNTIPAWMRPYSVLSNGEKFRVEMARRLLRDNPIVIDEFTSVVDRQVAQIGSHAVQKQVRKMGKQFVAASCHYDIVDWLQPDWILEPATMKFVARGSLQRRPALNVEISRVKYDAWHMFAPFHYLTADLNKTARCYCLFVDGKPAAFAGVLHRPHAKVNDIRGLSRLVTLPDWQGLGLAMVLTDTLGAAYKAAGFRFHTYPAHPSLVRSFARSEAWRLVKKPGTFSHVQLSNERTGHFGGRPNAVFVYSGDAAADVTASRALLGLG